LLLFERVLLAPSGVEDQGHGLGREVAALDEPFISLKAWVMSRVGIWWLPPSVPVSGSGLLRSLSALGSAHVVGLQLPRLLRSFVGL
jgi:hypothetical protein